TRPPRTYAVIVGISDYQRFSPVDYADNDATLFQSHLRSPRGGSAPENQIFTLTNKQATKAAVSSLLEQVFAKLAGPQDTVYLFFSGQGLSETAEEAERGYLLQFDSDPQEKYSSAYSIDELRTLIRTRSQGVARVLM